MSFIQVKIFSSVKMCGFIGQLLDTVFIAVFNDMFLDWLLLSYRNCDFFHIISGNLADLFFSRLMLTVIVFCLPFHPEDRLMACVLAMTSSTELTVVTGRIYLSCFLS